MLIIRVINNQKIFILPLNPEHLQTDGVAMDPTLGPVLVDIFMIELEISLLLNLTKYITF